jgi:hypothetical protein
MRQTTLRFGKDLWSALEMEAERNGVSVAQYVRDAALQRVAYEAGRRDEYTAPMVAPAPRFDALAAQERARSEVSASDALWAQAGQARRRAEQLRSHSESVRASLGRPKT